MDTIETQPFVRTFGVDNKHWSPNSTNNRLFLQVQENYANDMLHARGHVFLNEVFDMLGLPRSRAGALNGWSTKNSDSFVQFKHVAEANEGITLEFNVDGEIIDLV